MKSKNLWRTMVIVLALLVVAACGGDGSGSDEERAADPVVAYYDTLNTEDVAGVLEVWPSGNQDVIEIETAAFHVKVSATCAPGDDPDTTVQCNEDVGRHDFYRPAGITGPVSILFTVEDGVMVAREAVSAPDTIEGYEVALGEWLEASHPDVYASSYQSDGPYPFATAEQALTVIALIDDFLDQSNDYPLSP
jgi:hypothetical protein